MKPKEKRVNINLEEADFWYDLPIRVKAGIERGIKDTTEGRLTSYEEVMKKHSKYL